MKDYNFLEQRSRTKVKKWAGLALILALVALIFWGSRHRPHEVLIQYELPAHISLQRLHVAWIDEDQGMVRSEYQYGGLAPRVQNQKLALYPGKYLIRATLEYGDGSAKQFDWHIEIDDQEKVQFQFY